MFGRSALRSGLVSKDGMKRYLDFLNGGRTSNGLTFNQFLDYSDQDLESDHSFIQWVFPLPDPSRFNPDAPLIDICQTLKNPLAQEKIVLSYGKMKEFWGLGNTPNREKMQCLDGHNGLRFSRVLQSLVYHDKADLAQELLGKVCRDSLCMYEC